MAPHIILFGFMLYYKLETHLCITTIIHILNRKQKACSIMINIFFFGMCAHRSVCVCFFTFLVVYKIDDLHAGLQYSRILFLYAKIVSLSYALAFFMFRIGWISILGFKRALILLPYHLSSLLK